MFIVSVQNDIHQGKCLIKNKEGKAGTTRTNKQARIFNTGTAQNFGKLFILTINHVSFVIKLLKLRFQLWATC